jgi:hypothetical protein
MPGMIVPTPTVDYKSVGPGLAALEGLLELRSPKVVFPDGSEFGQASGTAGFFVYRQPAAAPVEIWNDELKRWEADPGPSPGALKPKPLIFKADDAAAPWQSPIVAAGQKDKDGKDQFGKAKPDFPRYHFRTFFAGESGGIAYEGLSAPTAPVRFVSALDAMRAGINVGEDETPEDATEITLFLKDSSLRVLGSVHIRSEGGSARVEVSNAQGGAQRAVVRLLPNGDIELQPAAGRSVVLGGPVLAGSINYQPADPFTGAAVGGKKWLQT